MRRRTFFAATTMALFLAFAANPVHAAFSFTKKPQDPKNSETRLDLTGNDAIVLAQIGPSKKVKKESQGKDILLPIAIELISPDGWTSSVEKGLRDKKVSWQSKNGDWVETLETLGRDEGVRFVVNWQTHKIAAGEQEIKTLTEKAEKTKTKKKADAEKKAETKKKADAEKKAEAEEHTQKENNVSKLTAKAVKSKDDGKNKPAVTMAEKPWELKPGSLKDQLNKWCERAGYNLIWDNQYDYRLDAGQTFYGEYIKAVNKVITALYNNGARIKADIYTKNKVLYISGGPER